MINIMDTTIAELDKKLKIKIIRIEYIEKNLIIEMEEGNSGLSRRKRRNKNKHEQSKKHKCFSNLNINKYIIRNHEIDEFKDIIQTYYNNRKKKFDDVSVCVTCL